MIQIKKLFCFGCGKDVYPESGSGDYVPGPKIKSCMCDNAIVEEIVAGYGSKHDMTGFAIAICDDCADFAIKQRRLVKICDGFNGGYDFDRELKELIEKQYE